MNAPRLFHVAPPEALERLGADGLWSPPSLVREGFVHLSFAHQLAGTLEVHFAGAPPQRLFEVAPEGVADALRVEASRGGAGFPHLYRALRAVDVLRSWPLVRRGGAWTLPALGPDAAVDEPPGEPFQCSGA